LEVLPSPKLHLKLSEFSEQFTILIVSPAFKFSLGEKSKQAMGFRFSSSSMQPKNNKPILAAIRRCLRKVDLIFTDMLGGFKGHNINKDKCFFLLYFQCNNSLLPNLPGN